VELRSFAAKSSLTVENDREQSGCPAAASFSRATEMVELIWLYPLVA
jgi:hypothetical protein